MITTFIIMPQDLDPNLVLLGDEDAIHCDTIEQARIYCDEENEYKPCIIYQVDVKVVK